MAPPENLSARLRKIAVAFRERADAVESGDRFRKPRPPIDSLLLKEVADVTRRLPLRTRYSVKLANIEGASAKALRGEARRLDGIAKRIHDTAPYKMSSSELRGCALGLLACAVAGSGAIWLHFRRVFGGQGFLFLGVILIGLAIVGVFIAFQMQRDRN